MPAWRIAQTNRHLDELILLWNYTVKFNGKPAHGCWTHEDRGPGQPKFLDINVNVRWGEQEFPDEGPMAKWVRFQRIPGTLTWYRCEPTDDLQWAVVLTPLGMQHW